MKKILFLIPTLGGGGAEKVLINLVNNLDLKKYDITVQTLFDEGVNKKYLSKNIKYIPGLKKQFHGNVLFMKLFTPKQLYHYFIKGKYDIIVSYLEGPTARIVSGCTTDAKLLCWIHGELENIRAALYGFSNEEEANGCYNRFDSIICVADTVKKSFLSCFNIEKPLIVLYNTNEDNKIKKLAEEKIINYNFSKEINIISVGRLRPEKGYDRLINVHKKLLIQGIKHHIYILGEGPDKDNLINFIHEYGIEDTFHLLGYCENPYKYVKNSDLFVCSSRREGFSTAVTEALILGVPVVSTDCSGAKELLGNNNEFGIVTENSEQGIYDGLYKMLSNPEMLKHYKEKSLERGKFFSKDNTVKAVEEMLDNL